MLFTNNKENEQIQAINLFGETIIIQKIHEKNNHLGKTEFAYNKKWRYITINKIMNIITKQLFIH